MLRHVMLFKAQDIAEDKLTPLFDAFLSLKQAVPGVMGFSTGQNLNGTLASQGFTHLLMMDFVDKDFFDYFHQQSDYERIRQIIRTLWPDPEDIVILDYQIE